jgi:hypothetical protein
MYRADPLFARRVVDRVAHGLHRHGGLHVEKQRLRFAIEIEKRPADVWDGSEMGSRTQIRGVKYTMFVRKNKTSQIPGDTRPKYLCAYDDIFNEPILLNWDSLTLSLQTSSVTLMALRCGLTADRRCASVDSPRCTALCAAAAAAPRRGSERVENARFVNDIEW